MSMFKQFPADNIIATTDRNFVTIDQLNNVKKIPQIQIDIANTLTSSNIRVINEYLSINNGSVTLSYSPVSNVLILDTYMIIDRQDGKIIIVGEVMGDIEIINKRMNVDASFNGLEVVVSYLVQGE